MKAVHQSPRSDSLFPVHSNDDSPELGVLGASSSRRGPYLFPGAFGGVAQGATDIAQILFYVVPMIGGPCIIAGSLLEEMLTS